MSAKKSGKAQSKRSTKKNTRKKSKLLNVKKTVLFFGLIIIFGSLCISFYIILTIFSEGRIAFIEPNLFMLSIEMIWVLIGLISLPFIVHIIFKEIA